MEGLTGVTGETPDIIPMDDSVTLNMKAILATQMIVTSIVTSVPVSVYPNSGFSHSTSTSLIRPV